MTTWKDDIQKTIKTISQISALINSSLDIREVINNSLAAVEQFIEVETSSIFELDTTSGELFFCCARGPRAAKIQNLRLKIGEGVAGYVAQTERAVIVGDVSRDPRFLASFDAISGFTTRSILCVPLKVKNRLIGVLELLNKKDGTAFDEEDLDIISILANQIGIAMENARLYQKVQEKLQVTVEELKFTQGKLLQSERLAVLGKLAQGVAHEVRNPVTIIAGLAHLMSKKIPATDPGQDLLKEITAATFRMERMVKEIESFARMPEPRIAPADLVGVIQAALSPFAERVSSSGISLVVQVPADLPLIPMDVQLMGQVFRHLIENSLESMPHGGTLSLTVTLEAKVVRITLQDTGKGIPTENLSLVFDPFFSTKPQGTGMGLTVAHRIVSEHKGEICLSSTSGAGVTVDLCLPRWPSD
jgi:two-component system sensor histidine kinase HydH